MMQGQLPRAPLLGEQRQEGGGLSPASLRSQERRISRIQKGSSQRLRQEDSGRANGPKRHRDGDKVKELEAIAAAKVEQVSALLRYNNELKFKDKILSDAVLLRDIQLRIVREAANSPSPWPVPAFTGGSNTVSSQADAALRQLQLMGSAVQVVHAPGSVRLLLTPEMHATVKHADVRLMGREQMAARWRVYLEEASALLVAVETGQDNEASARRLQLITAETGSLMRSTALLMPETMNAVMQTHMETGQLAAPESGFWTQVLGRLQLTHEQLREMRAVYELFSGEMRRLLAERRPMRAQLAAGLQAVECRAMMTQLQVPPECEVVPALERNLRKESAAHMLVRAFLFGRILSIAQFCRAAVHSYPFFPSATGLAAAAAGESI